jgi:L-threonylcarbamoyladenylate synthase
MNTRCIRAEGEAVEQIAEAVYVLRGGGLVAFPTDTVYGVGTCAFDAQAVERLYAAKERPPGKAIAILLARSQDVDLVAQEVPPVGRRLAAQFWPGPLTLVLARRAALPDVLASGGATVAVRVPDHPLARALISALAAPLAATSANLSGQPDPVSADEVLAQLGGRIDLVLDGGPCPGGKPSTVIDLTVQPPALLRPGPIEWRFLEKAWQEGRADRGRPGEVEP